MPLTHSDDKVWFDTSIKFRHLCDDVARAKHRSSNVLILSHFDTTVLRMERLLNENQIRHEQFALFDSSLLASATPGNVWLGNARALQLPNALVRPTAVTPLEILVTEHHPLSSRDREVIDAAAKLPCDTDICFYFSLDDPLMRHFGSDNLQALLTRLGMPPDESISHPFVTKAIRRAQEDIERKVPKDFSTQSIEDWFRHNLPKD